MFDLLFAQVVGENDLLKTLANNGPWAVVAGVLIWQLLKERQSDRIQMIEMYGKLITIISDTNTTVFKLSGSIDKLTDEQRRMSDVLTKLEDKIDGNH